MGMKVTLATTAMMVVTRDILRRENNGNNNFGDNSWDDEGNAGCNSYDVGNSDNDRHGVDSSKGKGDND